MARVYSATFKQRGITTVIDLFELTAPADSVVELFECHITQDDQDTADQLLFQIYKASAGGSGGAAATVVPLSTGDPVQGSTVNEGNTTQATLDKLYLLQAENVLNGFHWVPVPKGRIRLSPSEIGVVSLETAPTVSTKFSGYLLFEELGG